MRAPKRRKLQSGELASGEKFYFYRKPSTTGAGSGGKRPGKKLGGKAKKATKSGARKRSKEAQLGPEKDAEG